MSALIGPYAGKAIDQLGERPVLIFTNLVFAIGLVALGMVQDTLGLFGAWLLIGVGMGAGLYEAAFAALVRLYGRDSRNVITGITLIAGFASTVGWPPSTLLEAELGWRGACFAWAALHLVLGIPLNAALPKAEELAASTVEASPGKDQWTEPTIDHPQRAAVLLAVVFAATWFTSTAKGTLPLVLFGPQGYGHRQGLLMVPARIAQALASWLFGLCLDRWGAGALWRLDGLARHAHRT